MIEAITGRVNLRVGAIENIGHWKSETKIKILLDEICHVHKNTFTFVDSIKYPHNYIV